MVNGENRVAGSSWGARKWPWGQRTLARIAELGALLDYEEGRAGEGPQTTELVHGATTHLDKAKDAVDKARRWWWLRGGLVDSALANANIAHTLIIRLAPVDDFRGMLPDLVALVEENLPVRDKRRCTAEKALKVWKNDDVALRNAVVDAVRAAYRIQEREVVRVRSFARIVYGWAAGLLGLGFAIAVLGALNDDVVPLCFRPAGMTVCPTSGGPSTTSVYADYHAASMPADYLVVELAGLVSAAVTAAATLRQIRGSTTAYNVPLALAILKLPTGALTAVLGLLLMRGQFVPGLTALDTSGQIIAWAVVFGAAQQLFTRFVDERGNAVMQAVSGPENPRPATPHRAAGSSHAEDSD